MNYLFFKHLAVVFGIVLAVRAAPGADRESHETGPSVTPVEALGRLQSGNQRFVAGTPASRDLRHQREETTEGQHPYAAVLSCIDSRVPAEIIFDQGIGDIFNVRVAGNIADGDVLASLEYATSVAGARLVIVVGHTNCGAVKGAVDNVHLGHVTGLVAKIRPLVSAVAHGEALTSANHELVERVSEANVRHVTRELMVKSRVLRHLVAEGKIQVMGAMYDLHTGGVTFYTGNVNDSPR